jgi:L,D-transpeptidase YcbB
VTPCPAGSAFLYSDHGGRGWWGQHADQALRLGLRCLRPGGEALYCPNDRRRLWRGGKTPQIGSIEAADHTNLPCCSGNCFSSATCRQRNDRKSELLDLGMTARIRLGRMTMALSLPVLALTSVMAAGTSAQATDAATERTAIAWPVVPDPSVDPVIFSTAAAIEQAAESRRHHSDDLDGVQGFYKTWSQPPLWVGDDGPNAAAKAAMDELKKADDWGLRSGDYVPPSPVGASASDQEKAQFEAELSLEVLRYARHARGGRVNPASVTRINDFQPPVKDATEVLAEIAAAPAADAYLRDLHPKHQQFVRLRQALLEARGENNTPERPVSDEPSGDRSIKLAAKGPELQTGERHSDVAVLRKRLGVAADVGANPHYFDEPLATAVRQFQEGEELVATGWLDGETRRRLNRQGDRAKSRAARSGAASSSRRVQLILNNMERWRWLPYDMGELHVWNNVPEFRARVLKGEEVIFNEKIIVGLTDWATPSFFADMKYIVFHPSWGVPNGIKTKELLPRLKKAAPQSIFDLFSGGGGGGASVLKAYHLTAYRNGQVVDPNKVNWGKVDIRNYSFVQPPGPKNPLGIVKFRFPNKHNVYMHDTIERELFAKSNRIYSHGCIRVQNPIKLAAVLIGEDKGWSAEEVRRKSRRGGSVTLDQHIPVYVTYMTARVDDDGKLRTYGDVYGRDSRLAAKLGQSMRFDRKSRSSNIVTSSTGESRRVRARIVKKKKVKKKPASGGYSMPTSLGAAISGGYN